MNAKFETPERTVILTMTEMEARHLAYILFQRKALEDGFSLMEDTCSAETVKAVLAHADKVASVIRSLSPDGDIGEGIHV